MKSIRLLPLLVLASMAGAPARAADSDPRAEVKVQVSPLEAVRLWSHLRLSLEVRGGDEGDSKLRLDKALGMREQAERVEAAERKREALVDSDFSEKRATRSVARDDLDRLWHWLNDKCDPQARGCPSTMSEPVLRVLGPLRQQFKVVLDGGNPYKAEK